MSGAPLRDPVGSSLGHGLPAANPTAEPASSGALSSAGAPAGQPYLSSDENILENFSTLAAAVMQQQQLLAALAERISIMDSGPRTGSDARALHMAGQRPAEWRALTRSVTGDDHSETNLVNFPAVNPAIKSAAADLKGANKAQTSTGDYFERPTARLKTVGVHTSKIAEAQGMKTDEKILRRAIPLLEEMANEHGQSEANRLRLELLRDALLVVHVRHRTRLRHLREEEAVDNPKARRRLQTLQKERDDGVLDVGELRERKLIAEEVAREQKAEKLALQIRTLEAQARALQAAGPSSNPAAGAAHPSQAKRGKRGGGGGNGSANHSNNNNNNNSNDKAPADMKAGAKAV